MSPKDYSITKEGWGWDWSNYYSITMEGRGVALDLFFKYCLRDTVEARLHDSIQFTLFFFITFCLLICDLCVLSQFAHNFAYTQFEGGRPK